MSAASPLRKDLDDDHVAGSVEVQPGVHGDEVSGWMGADDLEAIGVGNLQYLDDASMDGVGDRSPRSRTELSSQVDADEWHRILLYGRGCIASIWPVGESLPRVAAAVLTISLMIEAVVSTVSMSPMTSPTMTLARL